MRVYARFVFAALAICFIFLNLFGVFDNTVGPNADENPYSVFEHLRTTYNAYDECLNQMLSNIDTDLKFWENYANYSSICIAQTDFKRIAISEYANSDEQKFYVHHEKKDVDPSVVITLGIGEDVRVETQLKEVLNKGSKFYGADPIVDDNERLYSPIGHFYPFAVGKKTGISQANVYEGIQQITFEGSSKNNGATIIIGTKASKNVGGSYKMKQMMHVDIMTFMRDIVRQPIVDMFLMDNEGPEYDIIPLMLPDSEFDKNGITICQSNIEVHGGHDPECRKLMTEILKTRRYVPLKSVNVGHIRIFLLNIESEFCVNRYLSNFHSN